MSAVEDVPPDIPWYDLMRADSSMMPFTQSCRIGGVLFLTKVALVGYEGKAVKKVADHPASVECIIGGELS